MDVEVFQLLNAVNPKHETYHHLFVAKIARNVDWLLGSSASCAGISSLLTQGKSRRGRMRVNNAKIPIH